MFSRGGRCLDGGGLLRHRGFRRCFLVQQRGKGRFPVQTNHKSVTVPPPAPCWGDSIGRPRAVDVLLESSTNFVDWVQALPGTYGTSSQTRYFRVRAGYGRAGQAHHSTATNPARFYRVQAQ